MKKKILASFLVLSLLGLSGSLYAKEKRGVEIKIYKIKPGMEETPWETPYIRGELIAVKKNSLLLLESETGTDVSIDIEEVKVINVVGRSNFLKCAGIGALIVGGIGALTGEIMLSGEESRREYGHVFTFYFAAYGAGIGALLGGISGLGKRTYETIQIEGKSDLEVKEILEKLRSKARFPDHQ